MLDAGNRIDSMDKMLYIIEDIKNKNRNKYNDFLVHIQNEHDNGDLEPENYSQLHAQLDSEATPAYENAFDEDVPKMLNYLQALRQKIDEYMKISG